MLDAWLAKFVPHTAMIGSKIITKATSKLLQSWCLEYPRTPDNNTLPFFILISDVANAQIDSNPMHMGHMTHCAHCPMMIS